MPRSRLLDVLQGAAPEGLGEAASPVGVGTDVIPTSALEQGVPSGAPEPPAAGIPAAPEGAASPEEEGIQSIIGAPNMTPDQRAELEAELALAARQRLMRGGV